MKNPPKYLPLIIGISALFVLIPMLNSLLSRQVDSLVAKPVPSTQAVQPAAEAPLAQTAASWIALRVERQVPGEEYTDNVVLVDKAEVAQFKNKEGKMDDLTGQIPDGRIKFVNEGEKTYGFEHFKGGKRHGVYTEYYGNDQVKTEAEFANGSLLSRKSYFQDGVLRMEEDYRQGRMLDRFLSLTDLAETGVGKIYRPDGSLKYEWSIVDGAERNFNKAYNKDGELIEANYYNSKGVLVEHWEPQAM